MRFPGNIIKRRKNLILPIEGQLRAWNKANRKMKWGIRAAEFEAIEAPPSLTKEDRRDGFVGVVLFYGFGNDGQENSDPILSGRLAWEYAKTYKRSKTWRCEYIDFDRVSDIRLRPGAPERPRGFYFAKFQPGNKYKNLTVAQARRRFDRETGCGPEGLQFVAVTHKHFQKLMDERKVPLMALADYDVAPHGFNDFYDAVQVFHSIGILGLGIGNVDRNYPLFGIPTLRFRENSGGN
ncbi:MAG: hypothetical protein JRJ29_12545 [Deltaproteobacteria bacterium]|nr:hypothetical protein [Deltaproteobacteria bacterium]